MTELEYVITNFAQWFAGFREKRIVLHGSRNYAEAIIDNFAKSFNFIGIMSLDPLEGGYFHGLKVLHEADLSALQADLVILTERVKYEVAAFHFICTFCRKNHIAVYNMYGLDEVKVHLEFENAGHLTLADTKMLCKPYDIIAFEVVDTLTSCSYDRSALRLRKLFYDLIVFLYEQGKEIRFSIRKSFPVDTQIELLNKFKLLHDRERQLIYRYGEDLSFRKLKETNPGKKILYFGSGLANEFILPRYYGIDTYRFVDIYNFDCLVPGTRKPKKQYPFSPDFKLKIEQKISEKEWVSFDVFDTLIMRKTLFPRDVFLLTEQKALTAGYDAGNFALARIRAEEEQPFCDISLIYTWLQDYYGWSDAVRDAVKALEMTVESEVLTSRTEVAEVFNFAKRLGKHIVLVSDMYLPEALLRNILVQNGISGYEKILVSCDVKKSKQTGLYSELLCLCGNPGKIVHIGDNPVSDGVACEACGIESILIPSVLEMAKSRGWENCIYTASNLLERSLLGLIICNIFRDPFQNPNLMEWPVEEKTERFGISVVASLAIGHMTWLIQKLRGNKFNGVLFFARDGWLSWHIYQRIRESLPLPLAVYYYANRHSAFLCCADSEQEVEHLVESAKKSGMTASELLKNIYCISGIDMYPYEENGTISDYIRKLTEQIRQQAIKMRKGFMRYSEKNGIFSEGSYAVVDGFASGHTQMYLSKVLPFGMKGFYIGKNSAPSLDDSIEYYLKNGNSLLLQRFIELETFFTSPEPSQSHMSEEGNPVFLEERRDVQELCEVTAVLKQAEEIACEFFALFYQKGQHVSSRLIEEIYAAEDYYAAKYTLYDDWFGVPIGKREDVEKEYDDEQS